MPVFKLLLNRYIFAGLSSLLLIGAVFIAWNEYKTTKEKLKGEQNAKALVVAALEEQVQKEQHLLDLLKLEKQFIKQLKKREEKLSQEKNKYIQDIRETNEQIANKIRDAVKNSKCVNERYDPVVINSLRRAAENARSRGVQKYPN